MMKFYSGARRILTAQKILSTIVVTSNREACERVEGKEIDGEVSFRNPHNAGFPTSSLVEKLRIAVDNAAARSSSALGEPRGQLTASPFLQHLP
jgi:hypothetical protein